MPDQTSTPPGYRVTRYHSDANATHYGITYRTARGTDIAAGTVTRHAHSGHTDVRTDAGEPLRVGSPLHRARLDAVIRYESQRAAQRASTQR